MKAHLAVNKDFRLLQKVMFIVNTLPYCKPVGGGWGFSGEIGQKNPQLDNVYVNDVKFYLK